MLVLLSLKSFLANDVGFPLLKIYIFAIAVLFCRLSCCILLCLMLLS